MIISYIEHVLHVVQRNERIIHSDDLNIRVRSGSSENQSSDAAEAVDSDLDRPLKR